MHAQKSPSNTYADALLQVSLVFWNFSLSLYPYPYLLYAINDGSDEYARLCILNLAFDAQPGVNCC